MVGDCRYGACRACAVNVMNHCLSNVLMILDDTADTADT